MHMKAPGMMAHAMGTFMQSQVRTHSTIMLGLSAATLAWDAMHNRLLLRPDCVMQHMS